MKKINSNNIILVLHYGGSVFRGSEHCLVQAIYALNNHGFNVILCRNNPVIDVEVNSKIPSCKIIDFEYPELMLAGLNETTFPVIRYLHGLLLLHTIVRRYRPQIIYCNSGLPCQLAVPIAHIFDIKTVCHLHHPAIKRAYYLWLVYWANAHIFPSCYVKTYSYDKVGIKGEVVYNGIDTNKFVPLPLRDNSYRLKYGIVDKKIVIGQVAQMVPHKRPQFLIHAFQKVKAMSQVPVHLCLVGSGEMIPHLNKLIKELRLEDSVTITGYVPDVLPFYQHVFDISVCASREEGLGISAIEASASGLPLVVSNSTGLQETVIDGKTGLLFEQEHLEDLAEKLLDLVTQPEKRRAMGSHGRIFAEEKFGLKQYHAGITSVISRVINESQQKSYEKNTC